MTKQDIKRQKVKRSGCGNLTMIEHTDGTYRFMLAKNGTCAYGIVQGLRAVINEVAPSKLEKVANKLIGIECNRGNCCVDKIGRFLAGEYDEVSPTE